MPLAVVRLPDAERLCEDLTTLFLDRAADGDAWRNEKRRATQHGALFESRFDLFQWPERPVQAVAKFCHAQLSRFLREVSDYSDEELQRLRFDYHAWFHVTRAGGYQGLHNHQNATWSGIFCVDPGDDVPDRPDSGLVRFHDPRWCSYMHSDAGNTRLKMPWRHGGYDVRHRAGQLVIFPSYVMHEIFPYVGERPRVVIAFNRWLTELSP